MTELRLTLLIEKYLSGKATEEEKRQIENWYESFDTLGPEFEEGDPWRTDRSLEKSLEAIKGKIAQDTEEMPAWRLRRKRFRWWHAAAAAAVLVFISEMVYLSFHKTDESKMAAAVPSEIKDFEPGGNRAVLTLGNGQQIVLDSTNNGLLSVQGNTRVIKLNNGQLAYNSYRPATGNGQRTADNASPAVVQYNTISTPRGGSYEIVLPDGSKVWLNAASSVRFPTVFAGEKREVQITGEAYFEVAGDAAKPFVVKQGEVEIQVLGTRFNVMAYHNEPDVKVTLLEGAVRVKQQATGREQMMKPGEQAQIGQDGRMRLVAGADVKETVAWKNNLFWFDNDDVQAVMRQLSRWYDADIVIKDDIPDLFTGSIPRDMTFSKVFEVLQQTGSIQYKIEDNKTVIITR